MRIVFSVFLLLNFVLCSTAQQHPSQLLEGSIGRIFFEQTSENSFEWKFKYENDTTEVHVENQRLVAIALNITLGTFGMHRIYLGTDVKVPVFYTLTLGGGMVLWVMDLGFLIFSKDISKFRDNPRIFMWTTPDENEKTQNQD